MKVLNRMNSDYNMMDDKITETNLVLKTYLYRLEIRYQWGAQRAPNAENNTQWVELG